MTKKGPKGGKKFGVRNIGGTRLPDEPFFWLQSNLSSVRIEH
jgi:hypothetical protein